MRLLKYSNSMHKYKLKKKRNKRAAIEWIVLVLFVVIFGGYLYENVQADKILTNNSKSCKYAVVGDTKLAYSVTGQSGYTVILESNSGYGSVEWSNVTKKVPKNVKLLYYDRAGYGKSGKIDSDRTPEQLAEELHTVIEKSQYSGPYIFVGNEYGALIVQKYNEKYGNEIAGVVLINPLDSKDIEDMSSFSGKISLSTEKMLGSIGMLRIWKKVAPNSFDSDITGGLTKTNSELYTNFRVNTAYSDMKLQEMKGIKGESFNYDWIYKMEKPVVVLNYDEDEEFEENIKNSKYIESGTVDSEGTAAAVNDYEAILNAITNVSSRLPDRK